MMENDPKAPPPAPLVPSAPEGADEVTRDFLQLLRDLDALREPGTTIEHINPETYQKKVRS